MPPKGVRPTDTGGANQDLEERCIGLVEELKGLDEAWVNIGPESDPDGRNEIEQQRAIYLGALNTMIQFLHDLDGTPRSTLVLRSLLGALIDVDKGRPNPRLAPQPDLGKPRDKATAALVKGEAVAAVDLLRVDGHSERKACEVVVQTLRKLPLSQLGLPNPPAWHTVRNWYRKISTEKTAAENISASRMKHVLELVEKMLPDATKTERADWILKNQIPLTTSIDR
jgi:hypothetical protein